ncbi:MAG: hypothetical protein ACRBI6_03560 [Acidimicrobiales bacterium]
MSDLHLPPPPAAADVIDLGAHAGRHPASRLFADVDEPAVAGAPQQDDLEVVPDDSIEALLADVIDLVSEARPAPMSSMVKVDRDELLDLLEAALDQIPAEVQEARWVMRDREALLEQGRRERDALIDEGRLQVARMVERQEIVRAAERKARQVVEEARTEARELQHKVEDYCDSRLAEFEGFLQRTTTTVRQSRQRLAGELPERRNVEG